MSKVSIIIYITVALLLLLLISHSPKKTPNHRHRRLKLRSNFTFAPTNHHHHHHHESVPFDPLVADIERRREDRHWERQYVEHNHPEVASHLTEPAPGEEAQPEWEDFADAEDYLNDDNRFNVTDRLSLLFPKIDGHPTDGFVTVDELTEWNLQQAERETLHRTQREMETHDKNHDGLVSFSEYEPPSWVRNSDNGSFGYEMGWWKIEHFNASDADGDGLLNLTEFNDFLHPADSKNPKLLHWLCEEEIRLFALYDFSTDGRRFSPAFKRVRERDTDRDGKMNFKEFFHGLFDLVRNYEENHNSSHPSDDSRDGPARNLFAALDKDNDGYLADEELLPIIGKIHPSERYYAKQQAEYIIQQADADKDGRLTLTEMIDHPYVFYSAIFNEDDEDDYDSHDEFR